MRVHIDVEFPQFLEFLTQELRELNRNFRQVVLIGTLTETLNDVIL